MQTAFSTRIPDGFMAAMCLEDEKPHRGVPTRKSAPYQGQSVCNSTTALGLQSTAVVNRIGSRSTCKERDAESGNDYFGARYYASSMGRWMSPDYSENSVILELPQSWNKYSYVLNRPTFGKDYDGRCPWCIGAAVGAVVEGGFDFGKQLYNNGGDLSAVNYREVGANALGGAVAGALAVATGGASLVESAVVGDIAAGGTANVVGGIVTRAAQGDNANEVLSGSEISQDAVSGFVGGGVGHLAGDVIHVPDEPIHNGRASTGAVRRDNAKFATYNNALRNQITRATVSGSAATHTTNGGFSLFNWLFNQPPPPPPPPTPTRNCTINVTPDGTSGDC
jgi:RHS repeat-associated protein